jgi:hypothetical protein
MARATRGLLAGILLLATVLRLLGIGFGLPYPYAEVDEHIVTDRALGFLRGDLDPHYFAYPSLCFDLHGALAWLQFVLGRIGGRWASLAEFRAACWVDPRLVLLPGRWLVALIGVATAWAAARAATELARALAPAGDAAARRFARRAAALLAALAVATCLLHVSNSRVITVDVPCAFFGALALAHALRHARRGRPRDLLLAAVHAGLAGSSKYYGALFALPAAAAALVAAGRAGAPALPRALRSLGVAAAATLCAFLATSPFVVLDWSAFRRDFAFLEQHVESGHYGFDPDANGALAYARLLAGEQVGLALLIPAGLAVALLLARRRARAAALVLLAQPLVHFVLIARFRAQPSDYLLPLVPALAAAAGAGAAAVAVRLATLASRPAAARALRLATVGALALLLLIPVRASVEEGLALRRPDSRVLFRDWAARTWPDGTRVATDSWLELPLTLDCLEQIADERARPRPIPLRRGRDWPDEQFEALLAQARRDPPAVGFDLLRLLPRELDLGDSLVTRLRANGFRWLVLNDVNIARTLRVRAQFPQRAALYERLREGPWVVSRFPAARELGSGPGLILCDLEKVPEN